jgi:FAD/FMN-containing dehydrogenase
MSIEEARTAAGDGADALAARLKGELLRPADAGYEEARKTWNGMIDRRPELIARCDGAEDVAAAVSFAREAGLPLAVRGGAHNVAGNAVCDGGLVIDLTPMKQVEVDPDRRSVRAAGGCTLGDVDGETQRFGLAVPLGVVTKTGIAGLTLSGGMGWLRRKHGLSCDNIRSAQVVTADGSTVSASASENDDLFWAIRGGGGNFGVVTEFEYELHQVGPDVSFCFVMYPAAEARAVLLGCDAYLAGAPEEISPLAVLGYVPEVEGIPASVHGEPMVALLALHPGDPEEGERVLQPLREIVEPLADVGGTMPYVEAQAVLDEDFPDGWRYYWKSVNVTELGDELIERLVAYNAAAPSRHSTIDVWYQGGAMARVGERDTAFANRASPYLVNLEANWEEPDDDDANVAWVRDGVADLRSFSDGGIYLNFPGFLEEGEDLVREGYGENYDRLGEVKAKYDPENLFRLNANVEPGG